MKARALMRCTPKLAACLVAIALCAAALAPSAARAQDDLRGILPFIMLVVDTSGSMERLPTCACTSPACEECLPECGLPNGAGGVAPIGKKNRWALTLEALTGTFEDFQCEGIARTSANNMTYDLGYYLPYFQPWDCTSQGAGTRCAFDSTNTTRQQRADGILDLNASAIRFGLMTFDGWDTMLGYPPLVSVADFNAAIDLSTGVQGLWSYGGAKPFHYPNCTTDYMMDTGARSAAATEGSLVSLDSCTGGGTPGSSADCPSWCSICTSTSQSINLDIQEALLATRPYGGTPIAASLDDLYFHFDSDNDVDDDFVACRDRYAILITDGYPDDDYRSFGCNCKYDDGGNCGPNPPNDPDSMKCPYPTAEDAARYLVQGNDADPIKQAQIERLYVLGLAVNDPVVVERLDNIANQGCKELDSVCTEGHFGNHHALFANDISALRTAVQDIVNETNRPISRTLPVFANSLDPTTPQYQFASGFTLPTQTGEPRAGVLRRRRFTCNTDPIGFQTVSASARDIFEENLNQQGTRSLKTALPTTFSGGTLDESLIRSQDEDRWTPGSQSCNGDCTHPELDDIDYTMLGVASDTIGDELKDWMYTRNGQRDTSALGAIFHSTPAVVGAPTLDTSDDEFNTWRRGDDIVRRPQVLYVGTNDGVLHAFATGSYSAPTSPPTGWRDLQAGEELWGFIPPMMLSRLNTSRTTQQTLMDGAPVVKNVNFDRDPTRADHGYHTVLVMGMREGGSGYMALDITDPFNPRFLWQVTDEMMGNTFGQPAIVQATFRRPLPGDPTAVRQGAVAILPGGTGRLTAASQPQAFGCNGAIAPQMRQGALPYSTMTAPGSAATPFGHRTDVRCWEPLGRALYFVDVADGYLIKKLSLPSEDYTAGSVPSDTNIPTFPSPIVSTPAPFPDDTGVDATRVFVTDADGVIWRVDMRDNDPQPTVRDAGWTARPFHDMFHGLTPFDSELTYEAPTLSTDTDGRPVVIVGTGDNGDFTKLAVRNRVASLTEVEVASVVLDLPEHYKAAFNWEMVNKGSTPQASEFSDGTTTQVDGLMPSELVTGPMVLFEGQLFFSTFIAVTDPDDVCALGRGRIHAVSYNLLDDNDRNPSGTFGPLRINASNGGSDNIINVLQTNTNGDNVMIMGLTLTQQPSCRLADLLFTDPWGQQWSGISGSGAPPPMYLAAHAAFDNNASDIVSDADDTRVFSAEIGLNMPTRQTKVMSWAAAIE